jgi:hypothetical protein
MESSYVKVLQLADSLLVGGTSTCRIDCVDCGGRNTLTISILAGKVVWNCYKANCALSGAKKIDAASKPLAQVQAFVSRTAAPVEPVAPPRGVPMPAVLSSPANHPKVLDFLARNGCGPAYADNLCRIAYDPKQDRVLFCAPDMSGASGKSLQTWRKPKWLIYGDRQPYFLVAPRIRATTAVLVEDALSACAIAGCGAAGIAILGTNMDTFMASALKKLPYHHYTICLDSDAGRKAIQIKLQLQAALTNATVSVRLLTGPDPKHMTDQQLKEIIYNES